ncbi:MAG: gamma-glutamyltransferase [Alphaproteobacteria bacterium]
MSPLTSLHATGAAGTGQRSRGVIATAVAAVVATTLLAACDARPPVGEVGNISGAIGAVAAVEPAATLVAQDTLSAGGTAADAVTAAYFTLLVTYPVAVGVGGGGICVTYDRESNVAETLDFRAGQGSGTVPVPGTLRGMAALHARYGRLPWTQLIGPAESNARFGVPMSRALARRVAENEAAIRADKGLAELFVNEQGALRGEGDPLRQVALSSVLGAVRSRGVGDFYGGESGRALVEAVELAGESLAVDDLRAYRATWRKTLRQELDNVTFHAPAEVGAGGTIAKLLQTLPAGGGGEAMVAASRAAYAGGADVPERPGDAGVVAIDRRGNGVACAFTLRQDFGSGRMARASGVILSAADTNADAALAPVVGANMNTDQVYFAGVASGGWPAALAVAAVARGVSSSDDLSAAIAAPRAAQAGAGGPVLAEQGAGVGVAKTVPALGLVQAGWCSNGAKSNPERCQGRSDPRGFGLGEDGG